MQKRTITIGTYSTAAHGWTLTGWKLGAAEQKTHYVEKVNGDGSWDLSTALTDGIPCYMDRPLTVTLERSEGSRLEREETIRRMINQLDGLRWQIQLPDDEYHYLSGRVHVVREYNDRAHAAVTVTAVCDPWKYSTTETVVSLNATTEKRTAQLQNQGRRAVVPTLTASGSVLLEYGARSLAMTEGDYKWADLLLTPGGHALTYSGSGSVVIRYREAVLE